MRVGPHTPLPAPSPPRPRPAATSGNFERLLSASEEAGRQSGAETGAALPEGSGQDPRRVRTPPQGEVFDFSQLGVFGVGRPSSPEQVDQELLMGGEKVSDREGLGVGPTSGEPPAVAAPLGTPAATISQRQDVEKRAPATQRLADRRTGVPLVAVPAGPLSSPGMSSSVGRVEAANARSTEAGVPLPVGRASVESAAITPSTGGPISVSARAALVRTAAPPPLSPSALRLIQRLRAAMPGGEGVQLAVFEREGLVQIVAAAPGLAPEVQVRLRRIASELAADAGLKLADFSLNGASVPDRLRIVGGQDGDHAG